MTIIQLTRFESSKSEEMIAIAKQVKFVVEKHGADSVHLRTIHDGPWIGEWMFVSRYSSWEVFGKTQGGLAKDPAWQKLMTQMKTIGKPTNRLITVEVEI